MSRRPRPPALRTEKAPPLHLLVAQLLTWCLQVYLVKWLASVMVRMSAPGVAAIADERPPVDSLRRSESGGLVPFDGASQMEGWGCLMQNVLTCSADC